MPGRHSPQLGSTGVRDRLVYVDRLRVFAVAAVFVIHVFSVFDPWDDWHITAPVRSPVLGEVVVLMAPWIMPLFMLLAGVSAHYSLATRSNGEYLRERIWRVLAPLAVGVLVLVPPQVYLERRLRGQFAGSFWAFYPHFFEGIYPRGNLSWHHLWFLAHLFVYSFLALPLFRYWQRASGKRALNAIARVYGSRHGLLWLALPLILERMLLWGIFPERHMLTSDWSNHALLFVAYAYGFVLAGAPALGEAIDAQWRSMFVVASIVTSLLVVGTWTGALPSGIPSPYASGFIIFWTLYALGAWAWVVAVVGMGRHWLRREGPELRYGREIGYEWYLLHQPVIVAGAYWVVRWNVGVAEQAVALFAISACGTWIAVALLRQGMRTAGTARRAVVREMHRTFRMHRPQPTVPHQ